MPEVNQYGDILPPGFSSVLEVKPADILASYARFTQKGITVAKVGAGEVFAAGTVMGRFSSGGAVKKYGAYATGNSDGTETAVGILRQAVDTTDGDKLGNLVISGIVKYDKVVGRDSGADTELNARSDIPNNLYVF